jgi:TPR repeat protein
MDFSCELPVFLQLLHKMLSQPNPAPQAVAEPAPAEHEQIAQAAAAFESREYAKAVALLIPLIRYPAAKCFLGLVYLDDPLQPGMRSQGWESLIASAQAGFCYAWLALGHRLFTGHDRGSQIEVKETQDSVEQARYWLSKGAELGCAYSQYFLSQCDCKDGDFVTAAKWLYLAATLGHEGASELCDSNALDLDSESLTIAQTQAVEWLNEKAASDDKWALMFAEIRACGKTSTAHTRDKLDRIALH